MPFVAGGLLISVLLLLQVLGLISLHRASLPLVRGLLGGFSEQKGFRAWFFRAIGLNALANAIAWVVHRVRQSVARAAAANLDAVTLYLHDASVIAHHTYKELGEIMPSWANSFGIFRTHTLPRAIKTHTLPAVAGAERAGKMADRSISLGNANRIRFGRSIDRLRKELGLLAGILLGIDILVKGLHARHHHYDHTHTIPDAAAGAAKAGALAGQLANTQAKHSALLKALAKLATLAGFTAVTRIALGRIWPWTRCSNFGRMSRLLKCSHFGFLADLLTLGLAFLAVTDPVVIGKAAIKSEDILDGLVRDLVNPSPAVTKLTEEAMVFLGVG